MAPDCEYFEYGSIFSLLGSAVREILLNDTERPYPIYEAREAFDADAENRYKGMVVWNSQKYYAGLVTPTSDTTTVQDVGFFVVPEFGDVQIIPNVEFKQILSVSFDTNSEPDYDPFGAKIVQVISWFINKYNQNLTDIQIELPNTGQKLFSHITTISRPIFTSGLTVYVRRSVIITNRYCRALR
jgi:hypothetical protein